MDVFERVYKGVCQDVCICKLQLVKHRDKLVNTALYNVNTTHRMTLRIEL